MQKSVEIKNKGLTLRGMVHTPQIITGRIPLVCLFHGFMGNKAEQHFIFVKLSRILENIGIASVRFDFDGSGESDGNFVDMTMSKELDDARAILNYAKSLDFVDTSKIAVLGISMGGAVASMLAGECKDDIKALCLWAPAGNMGELVMTGRSENDINGLKERGYYDLDGFAVGKDFVEDVLKLDIFGIAAPYDKNVLIIHGTEDKSVPFTISERYGEIYGTKAVIHAVKGSDHTFDSKEWEDETLEYTAGFLDGELKNNI
ncbi:alpha/beta superfamily hydrolase [Clostridium algifaecis]|uniref:Alpha/beta superfamily hydrolase n=1 Tax=Clostridium algifaecis TaxID=1472040 RepID=A0ABS4KXU3_9CLOT|nr:alpha/beta fold hydrolase [Clostridium algifaecis]MBP2034191.1 alpha/beta superfamily hydrolase [Clostridium algifaecis]